MTLEFQIDCADDALETAGTILRGRITQIFELRDAVIRSEDIEAVHDMRVVTRRMRSALRDLKPLANGKPFAKLVGALRSMAGTLGAARDLDVSIIALETMLGRSTDAAHREGIAKLIGERKRRRNEIQPTLADCVSRVALANLLMSFNGVFLDPAAKPAGMSFGKAGRRSVERAIDEFNLLSDSLNRPSQVDRLHQLRIAAKRLRYAIEFFGVCWGKRIKPFAREIAEMQTYLGELHDADIWIESLDRGPHDRLNRWLFSEFFKIRTINHRSAFELWGNWRRDGFTRKLRRLIDS